MTGKVPRIAFLSKLGEGTYGKVYDAKVNGKECAFKLNIVEHVVDGFASIREVDAMMRCRGHPNIISVDELIPLDRVASFLSPIKKEGNKYDNIAIDMQKGGVDLASILDDDETQLHPDDVRKIMYKILLGIEYMHSKQIMHRDLKPQNILVDDTKNAVRICDFGLSKQNCNQEPNTPRAFTPAYRPPEIWCGGKYTQRADIWSAGCIFFELLTRTMFVKAPANEKDNDPQKRAREALLEIFRRHPEPPTEEEFQDLGTLRLRTRIPAARNTWNSYCSDSNPYATKLLAGMLRCLPYQRWSAKKCLDSPYFNVFRESIERIRNSFPEQEYTYRTSENNLTRGLMTHLVLFFNTAGYITIAGTPEVKLRKWCRRRLPFIVFNIILEYCSVTQHTSDTADIELRFYSILYVAIKYLTTLDYNPSWKSVVPLQYRTAEDAAFTFKFEQWLLQKLGYQVYTPNPFDIAPGEMKVFEINDLFSYMVNNYPLFNKKTTQEVYNMYVISGHHVNPTSGVVLAVGENMPPNTGMTVVTSTNKSIPMPMKSDDKKGPLIKIGGRKP